MKEYPCKKYGKQSCAVLFKHTVHHSFKCPHSSGLLHIIVIYWEQHCDKFNKRTVVTVGCGRAQMEMHSSNFHICLDINKQALSCAKFEIKYLFRKKPHLILQHYTMKEGLAELLLLNHQRITWLELIVIFQHPSPCVDKRKIWMHVCVS